MFDPDSEIDVSRKDAQAQDALNKVRAGSFFTSV